MPKMHMILALVSYVFLIALLFFKTKSRWHQIIGSFFVGSMALSFFGISYFYWGRLVPSSWGLELPTHRWNFGVLGFVCILIGSFNAIVLIKSNMASLKNRRRLLLLNIGFFIYQCWFLHNLYHHKDPIQFKIGLLYCTGHFVGVAFFLKNMIMSYKHDWVSKATHGVMMGHVAMLTVFQGIVGNLGEKVLKKYKLYYEGYVIYYAIILGMIYLFYRYNKKIKLLRPIHKTS